jgi:1-acyl-sn-glycerol-3-phosphate acyltransferase
MNEPLVIPQMNRWTKHLSLGILHSLSHYRRIGMENIPEPPYVILANHLSYFDALVAASLTKHSVPVMTAKKYRGRWVGWMMDRFFAPVWLEQETADRQALKLGLAILEAGSPLAIAPEGTRSKTAQLQEGMEGAAFIIRKAGAAILPSAIWGTQNILRQLRPTVRGIIGKPYRLPDVAKVTKEVLKEDTERIMCSIAALLPPDYRGFYADHPRLEEMSALVRP